MIISDNTERGSIKLTCCSCQKKAYEREHLSAKERWNTKQNLHLSRSFLLPNLRSGVLCGLFSPWRARSCQLKVIICLEIHDTLTERLLANLTHLRFFFGFFLAHKNGFESVWFSETYMRLETERHQSQKWSGTEIKKPKMVWGCITLQAVGFSYAKRERNHCEQPSAFPSSMGELVTPHVMHLMPKFICQ